MYQHRSKECLQNTGTIPVHQLQPSYLSILNFCDWLWQLLVQFMLNVLNHWYHCWYNCGTPNKTIQISIHTEWLGQLLVKLWHIRQHHTDIYPYRMHWMVVTMSGITVTHQITLNQYLSILNHGYSSQMELDIYIFTMNIYIYLWNGWSNCSAPNVDILSGCTVKWFHDIYTNFVLPLRH